MKYLPIGLDLRGRPCLVVGGGPVGTRKVRNLRAAGAEVTLIAPQASPELTRMADGGEIRWVREDYREELLHGSFLAVAATDDQELNERLVEDAKQRKVLVCDASSAERSQVIFGALHVSEGVTIAVFTDGTDPARAREVRDRIAHQNGIVAPDTIASPDTIAAPDTIAGPDGLAAPDRLAGPDGFAEAGNGEREEG